MSGGGTFRELEGASAQADWSALITRLAVSKIVAACRRVVAGPFWVRSVGMSLTMTLMLSMIVSWMNDGDSETPAR